EPEPPGAQMREAGGQLRVRLAQDRAGEHLDVAPAGAAAAVAREQRADPESGAALVVEHPIDVLGVLHCLQRGLVLAQPHSLLGPLHPELLGHPLGALRRVLHVQTEALGGLLLALVELLGGLPGEPSSTDCRLYTILKT